LQKKIEKVPLADVFQEFESFAKTPAIAKLSPFEQGTKFLGKQYQSHFAGTTFYTHVTCAVDTESCKKVWDTVRTEMVKKAMESLGVGTAM